MDFRMTEALRKSRIFLLNNLDIDVLTDHLIDKNIFDDSMLDYIKAGSDRLEKIRRLLDNLIRRDDGCYHRFLVALNNSGHGHCAQRIEENYVQSGATQQYCPADDDVPSLPQGNPAENVHLGVPETGPSSSLEPSPGYFSVPVQESGPAGWETTPGSGSMFGGRPRSSHEVPASLSHMSGYQYHMYCNPQEVYRMESSPRGLALVINNEIFKHLPPRTGSRRDKENLDLMFKTLGIHNSLETDKTAEEMRELLKVFAANESLKDVDALVVVILSHGGKWGVIFGTEGFTENGQAHGCINEEEIRDAFSARSCPLMAHKPKLIIIQACKGDKEDMADSVGPMADCVGPTSPPSDVNRHTELRQDRGSMASSTSTRSANMADICLIHATVEGYKAYRYTIDGSPFIQEMINVFMKMANKDHLMDMMTEVKRKLANRQLSEDLRTVPSTTETLTKKWFFNPPEL